MSTPSNYSLIRAAAAVNYCLNPSFEDWATSGTYTSPGTVPACWRVPLSTVLDRAAAGVFGRYAVTLPNVDDTLTQVVQVPNGDDVFTVSVWIYSGGLGTPNAQLTVTDDGTHTVTAQDSGASITFKRWERVACTIHANGGTTELTVTLSNLSSDPATFDGVQVEAGDVATTYFDGDMGEGYAWSGQRWRSASTRSADARGGGRVLNLGTDLGDSTVQMEATGVGMPAVTQLSQANAALPGAEYLGYKIGPRNVGITVQLAATSDRGLWALRKTLTALVRPDGGGSAPFTLRYDNTADDTDPDTNPRRALDLKCVYTGGLEYNTKDAGASAENIKLAMTAFEEPYWIEELGTAVELSDTVEGSYGGTDLPNVGSVLGRIDGRWRNLMDGGLGNTSDGAHPLPGGVYGAATSADGIVYWVGYFIDQGGAGGYSRVAGWDGTQLFKLSGGQRLYVTGTAPASGYIVLTVPDMGSIGGGATGHIAFNANAGAVQFAIQTALDTAGHGGGVTVTGSGTLGGATLAAPFVIHFGGRYGLIDVDTLSISNSLNAGTPTIAHGRGLSDGAWGVDTTSDSKVVVGGAFLYADWTGTSGTSLGANRVAVHDPNATGRRWDVLGDGVNNGCNGLVRGITVAPNGAWIVYGDFTKVYDSAHVLSGDQGLVVNCIASYNPLTRLWSALANASDGTVGVTKNSTYGGVYCVVVYDNLTIVAGGAFSNAGGVAAADYLAKFENNEWKTMVSGVSLNGGVYALAIDSGGNLYATGGFTTPGSHICKLNSGHTAFYPLGAGLNGTGRGLTILPDGTVIAVGDFTTAGGISVNRVARWPGSAWTNIDMFMPGTPTVRCVTSRGDDWFIGFGTEGTGKRAAITTVNNPGQAPVRPAFVFSNSGTALEYLWWVERQNGDAPTRIYLNQTILPGETITVDCAAPVIRSDRRGNLWQHVIPGSDLATFELLPGDNTLATFVTRGGANEIQKLVVTGSGGDLFALYAERLIDNTIFAEPPIGTNFANSVAYNASAAALQAALDSDANMHYTTAGNTKVTGGAGTYYVEFINELAWTAVDANNNAGDTPVTTLAVYGAGTTHSGNVTITVFQPGANSLADVDTTVYTHFRARHYGIDGVAL